MQFSLFEQAHPVN